MAKRLLSWFLLLASAAAQGAPPARVELAYELTRNGIAMADVVQQLEHAAGRYAVTESWKGRGLFALRGAIRRTSRGLVTSQGLRPLEYADERTGRDTGRARFDWSARTVTYQYKGEAKTIPLPAHPHDRLAFLYEFAFKPPRPGTRVLLDVVDGKGVSDHAYLVGKRERMTIAAGEFDIVKLVREREGHERAEIWLAADRSYLPVRVLIVDKDGTRLDQVATRLSAS